MAGNAVPRPRDLASGPLEREEADDDDGGSSGVERQARLLGHRPSRRPVRPREGPGGGYGVDEEAQRAVQAHAVLR